MNNEERKSTAEFKRSILGLPMSGSQKIIFGTSEVQE